MTKLIVAFLSFANAPKQDAVQLVWQAVAASLILIKKAEEGVSDKAVLVGETTLRRVSTAGDLI